MKIEMAVAAVSMKTALKYRRDWNKNSPAVKALQKLMPVGPGKKGYRLYIPIGQTAKHRFVIPPAVRFALKKAGFVATDYLAKKCVKIADKDQKNVFNIGKVIAKDEHAKAAFDNDPQLQNSSTAHFQMVVSCHPYDIIGMSTGRDWDKHSCMRLDDGVVNKNDKGAYSRHVKNDVAEGTLVAYAIDANDTNINKPRGRCLIKPFVNDEGEILYRRENDIYGNPVPGFNSTLNAFIRKLNADAKTGQYEMKGDLYNDGISHDHHYEKNDSGKMTVDDVRDEPGLAVDFVKQEMEIIHEGERDEIKNSGNISAARSNANSIVYMLNDLDDKALAPSLDEIVELVRGSSFIEQYINDHALKGKINSSLAYVARKAGLLDRRKDVPFPATMEPTLALKQARSGNLVALEIVLQTLDNEENPDDLHPQILSDFMHGVIPIPEKEMLDKYHYAKSALYTIASASRFLSLFNYEQFHEAAYELLEIIEESTEKQRDNRFFVYTMKEVQGLELVMCYLLDNVGFLSPDDWFLFDTISMSDLLANRRAFRTFDRLQDNQAQLFMEHVKLDQMRVIATQPYRADAFKSNYDSIRKFFIDHPENVNSILDGRGAGRTWDIANVTNLVKFSVPMFLQLNGEGSAFAMPSMGALLTAIAEPLLAYQGGEEKAEVASMQMEFILQTLQLAGKMLDKPVDFSKHIDFEESDLTTLAGKFKNFAKADRNGGYLTYSGLLNGLVINGQTVDIMPEMDLIMSEAPASLYSLPRETIANNHRTLIKGIVKLTSMDTLLKSVENIMGNTEMYGPEDEDDYVNNEATTDVDPEDDDYDDALEAAQDKAREEVERLNQKTIETNTKCLRALEMLQLLIGDVEEEEEEEDDEEEGSGSKPPEFGYQTPQFTPAIFEEYASEIYQLREELKEAIIQRADEAEEYREAAGY